MILEEITALNRIIERESKSSTYKFALLRSVIDTINVYRPQYQKVGNRFVAPVGSLVEYWVYYYYPLFEEQLIPQIAGKSKKLAFETELKELIVHYQFKGGFSSFYADLQRFSFDAEAKSMVMNLVKKIANTITNMPMRYFGNSVSSHAYSYFTLENSNRKRSYQSKLDLIVGLGQFSISSEFFELLSIVGSIITGSDSLINRWTEYSFNASKADISKEHILKKLTTIPVNTRAISISESHFRELQSENKLFCIWSGKRLADYHLDHLFPYSIMRNNDLWNIMPSLPTINSKKSDKIPSYSQIENAKERLHEYWFSLFEKYQALFSNQVKLSLNQDFEQSGFAPNDLISAMHQQSDYLINIRGYEAW